MVEQRVALLRELGALRVERGDVLLMFGDAGLDVGLVLRGLLELRFGLVRGLLRGLEVGARPHDRGIGFDQALLRVRRRDRREPHRPGRAEQSAEGDGDERARPDARQRTPSTRPHRASLRTTGAPLSNRSPTGPWSPSRGSARASALVDP